MQKMGFVSRVAFKTTARSILQLENLFNFLSPTGRSSIHWSSFATNFQRIIFRPFADTRNRDELYAGSLAVEILLE